MTQSTRNIVHALVWAALLIAVPLAVREAVAAGLLVDPDRELGQRLYGITIGLMLAAFGNVAPRRLAPYDPNDGCVTVRQRLARFAGWAFVLAGLCHALVWAVATLDTAAYLGMIPVAAALVLVVGRCLHARISRA